MTLQTNKQTKQTNTKTRYSLVENVGAFGGEDPCIALEFDSADGKSKVVLCDYASVPAGKTFATWLSVDYDTGQDKEAASAAAGTFSKTATLRTFVISSAIEKGKSTIEAAGPAPPTPVAKTPQQAGGRRSSGSGAPEGNGMTKRRASLSELLQGKGLLSLLV